MKILLIQQKMIGDVLVNSVLCRHIKENLKGSTVHYLVNSECAAVLKNNPYIDEIILVAPNPGHNLRQLYQLIRRVRREKYDILIDSSGKNESMLITFFSGIPKRISYLKWYSRLVYSHPVDRHGQRPYSLGLALDHRLLLLEVIVKSLKEPYAAPEVYISKSEVSGVKALLERNGISESDNMLMVGILGSGPSKSYPLNYLAVLLDEIVSLRPDLLLLFNYSPGQGAAVEELISYCRSDTVSNIKREVYSKDLRSFLALLARCEGIVSNEGGAINMAKAVGIPTFSIYSPWIGKKGWHTFSHNPKNQAVHLKDYEPELFIGKDGKTLKSNSAELYNYFKPDYILSSIREFIRKEIPRR